MQSRGFGNVDAAHSVDAAAANIADSKSALALLHCRKETNTQKL
jgi:hypothetical protein